MNIRVWLIILLFSSISQSSAQSTQYYSEYLRNGDTYVWGSTYTNFPYVREFNITIEFLEDMSGISTEDVRNNAARYINFYESGVSISPDYDLLGKYVWEIYTDSSNSSHTSVFTYLDDLYSEDNSQNTSIVGDIFHYNYTSYDWSISEGNILRAHSSWIINMTTGIINSYRYIDYARNETSSFDLIDHNFSGFSRIEFAKIDPIFLITIFFIPVLRLTRKRS